MIKSIAIFRVQGNASMQHKKGDTFIKDCKFRKLIDKMAKLSLDKEEIVL